MNKIDAELRRKVGIYLFINTINGKRYVGSSKNLYNRLHEHLHNLRYLKCHNKHFQSAWNKYGEEVFEYTILEYCSLEELFVRELYYIDLFSPEYNLTLQVIANTGTSPSKEVRKKISETLKRKYALGEIITYKQQHIWRKHYIYDLMKLRLLKVCKNRVEASEFLNTKLNSNFLDVLIKNRYFVSTIKINTYLEFIEYATRYILKFTKNPTKYCILENDVNYYYFKHIKNISTFLNKRMVSTLSKHTKATKDAPYKILGTNYKFYFSNIYIPISRSLLEYKGVLQTNIGEDCDVNPEISIDYNSSIPSYSIEIEPEKSE